MGRAMLGLSEAFPERTMQSILRPAHTKIFCANGLLVSALAIPLLAAVQEAQQTQPPAQAQQQTDASASDEAAKAAERKKRFEEQKRRLEIADPNAQKVAEAEVDSDQTLFVSPAIVNMNAGDIRAFCVFDIDGKILTNGAEWSLSDSNVVSLATSGEPTIMAKQPGKTTLRARVGGRTTEASITVLEGNTMPNGTIKWAVPNYPGYKSKQIVQAVPTDRGPDIYTIEENAEGKSLIRAWTSEGIFLWMRKSDRRIIEAIPH
jgi:hypothetical protein